MSRTQRLTAAASRPGIAVIAVQDKVALKEKAKGGLLEKQSQNHVQPEWFWNQSEATATVAQHRRVYLPVGPRKTGTNTQIHRAHTAGGEGPAR